MGVLVLGHYIDEHMVFPLVVSIIVMIMGVIAVAFHFIGIQVVN
jgi:hypothetical protein